MIRYVIYCEDMPRGVWLVLEEVESNDVDGNPRRYFRRMAQCGTYADAERLLQAVTVTRP